jgi:pimeloyl-ACP methyl ester carboxylesterase
VAGRPYHAAMRTERIPVAPGVELAVDCWEAAAPAADGSGGPGRSPSFLLVHGLASNARMWDGVAEALADEGLEALTEDLRGHGRSSKPQGGYDVPAVADDLQALIVGIGLDRPIVVGQSWGGNVVLELAACHPGSTRGIALVDGGWLDLQAGFPDWESCQTALAPPRLAGMPAADIERYIRSAHPDWPETGIRGALANFEVRPDGTVAPWLTFDRHILVLRGLWEHRPAERYPSITVPVLLCPADDGDEMAGGRKRQGVEAAAAAIPEARVEWFRGDHDIHAQHPLELAAALMTLAASAIDGGSR